MYVYVSVCECVCLLLQKYDNRTTFFVAYHITVFINLKTKTTIHFSVLVI